jgi:diguanylate cyclase (GGDEF)-like protein
LNLTGDLKVNEELARLGHTGGVIGGVEALMMWRMVTRMKEMQQELSYQAQHDSLTGVYNRRFILEHLRHGIYECGRYGIAYSAVLIDIDHFKNVNDAHGHAAGDMVLKGFVSRLQSCLRNTDMLGRWGGEEFLVLLPHTDGPHAAMAAWKWLQRVSAEPMELGKGESETITFSAGVASFDKAWMAQGVDAAVDAFLECLDKRLYRAKESGRNRVVDSDTLP